MVILDGLGGREIARDDVVNDNFASASWRGYRVNVRKAEAPEGLWTEPEQFQPLMPSRTFESRTEEGACHA